MADGVGVGVGVDDGVGVGVGVSDRSGVCVGVGVGVAFSRSRSLLRRSGPLKKVVELSPPPRLLPARSCEPVTNTTAQMKASTPVTSASRHWRDVSRRRGAWTVRSVVRARLSAARSSSGGGASGSNSSCGAGAGSTGRAAADGTAAVRFATALTVSAGRRSSSVVTVTMIGVIAAANTVPGSQIIGTTNAAVALAAPAISSVVIERPPPPSLRGSGLTPLHASDCYPRWTCEPGTMSSAPSGQRTQALCPPS